jgi:NADH-quinone oxidoreductase subunit H
VTGLIVLATAALGIALVEMIEHRSLAAPFTIVREALSTPLPEIRLGSPGWVTGAALALPAFVIAALALLPLSAGSGESVSGIFLAAMLLDFAAVCIATVGWSANRPAGVAALFGAILQYASYGIVIGFGMIGPAMAAQSLSPAAIVAAQHPWYALTQPGSLALFALGALAQAFRPPFDAPAQGALEALGGLPRLAFRWGLDLLLFTVAAYGATLFFGAGGGTYVGLLLATTVLTALALLGRGRRWSYVRTMTVFWRVAMPLALVNVLIVGVVVLLRWS